nr:integrase family protein [uncultured Albidiferax sp.]
MKSELNLKLIKSLSLEQIPVGVDVNGKMEFAANPMHLANGQPNPAYKSSYILWDSNRAAPPGFGVRVAGKKTYILRRKVNGKSIMPTVGNVADFNVIDDARAKAASLARIVVETGRNPNELARRAAEAELTLGQAMAKYREHMVTRQQKRAGAETLKVYDRAVRKLKAWGWCDRKVKDVTTAEIETKFLEGRATPEATEQAFRWPSRAVRWCISQEALAASSEGREPRIVVSPFEILTLNRHYRSQTQKNIEREEQSKRNPLKPSSTLGPFLEAAWSKRLTNDNETGVHYLLLMLLWGCRQSEHAKCVWGELLQAHGAAGVGRKTTSHVWLGEHEEYGPHVFFYRTKNELNHRLPITPMALRLLRLRQESSAKEVIQRGFGAKSRPFVFPARSRTSSTGHYRDATDLLGRLKNEAGLEKLTRHDLRRSFGSVMTALGVPESIKRRMFNHADVSVTDMYTKAEWELLRDWMTRIEEAILSKAPNVYNDLRPVDWPPLLAPERHICKPPAPRSGRPRKQLVVAPMPV